MAALVITVFHRATVHSSRSAADKDTCIEHPFWM